MELEKFLGELAGRVLYLQTIVKSSKDDAVKAEAVFELSGITKTVEYYIRYFDGVTK